MSENCKSTEKTALPQLPCLVGAQGPSKKGTCEPVNGVFCHDCGIESDVNPCIPCRDIIVSQRRVA